MPPSRRRQGSQQPARRPRVAGQRNRPHDETSVQNDAAADGVQPGSEREQEPGQAEPAGVAEEGVAPPVIGEQEGEEEPSGRPEEGDAESTAEMGRIPGADEPAEPADASRTGLFSRDFALPVSLVVIAAVLAGLAVWFHGEASALESGGSLSNKALVDAGRTSEVNGQVSSAVERVFSYSFADTAATENAAKDLLAGRAADQYNQLFGQIKQQAPAQKLVVTVKVVTSGVKQLDGDRAVVLLFLDQTATRTDANQTNAGAAQLTVNAERRANHWVITDLNMR